MHSAMQKLHNFRSANIETLNLHEERTETLAIIQDKEVANLWSNNREYKKNAGSVKVWPTYKGGQLSKV